MHMTLSLRKAVSCLLLGAAAVAAQDFGSHTLPADLADPAAKVLGAMNKAPNNGRNLGYSEGPACDAEGNLYFTEDNAGSGNIWKLTTAGQTSNFYNGSGLPNGLDFDSSGKLYSAEKGGIAVYEKSGAASRTMLPMNPTLNAGYRVNDLSLASNGAMWFTNHAQGNQFFYRSPAGKVTTYESSNPLGMTIPNGIEYIEEKKMLLVLSDGDKKAYRFDVADDGTISNKTTFATIAEPDGLTLDEKGNIYLCSYNDGIIYVYAPAGGAAIGKITVGGKSGNVVNCIFGGADGKTLFMTGNGGAYKLQMKVGGRKRPGTVSIRSPGLRNTLVTPSRADGFSRGYTLEGRKVDLRAPASIMLVTSPLSR
ncbi:MAG: SMP-30/Gluconolaconase/LRE-like region-containing protein [Fibrobacteres bacterium]|nr:SMP-30/Gluconolaconase/LRE-like region-containing protein [Fibrobacterota bacterium]